MSNFRDTFCVLAAVGISVCAPLALADSGTGDAVALKKFEEGKKAYEAGRFDEALSAFQASILLLPSPNTRLYIGRCYKAKGQVASAYTQLRLAMREAQDRVVATGEKRYKATRDSASTEANEIEARVPRWTITVPSDIPRGFSILVDGKTLSAGAWGVATESDPGEHIVAATADRHQPFSAKITLIEGEKRTTAVLLARVPTATMALTFLSKPGGIAVAVDGKPVESADAEKSIELDTGRHTVTVSAPGYLDFSWEGDLRDREDRKVPVDLKVKVLAAAEGSGTPAWVPITLGVLGAASLGFASFTAVRAKSASDAEKAKDPFERLEADRDAIKSKSTLANIMFIAGGVLCVGGGVLAFTTRWSSSASSEEKKTTFAPSFGVNYAGVLASGRF